MKRAWKTSLIFGGFSPLNLLITSCYNPTTSSTNQQLVVNQVSYEQLTSDSVVVQIYLKSNQLVDVKQPQKFQLTISAKTHTTQVAASQVTNNRVTFQVTNLTPNTTYHLTQLTDHNQKVSWNQLTNLSFTTKNDKALVNEITPQPSLPNVAKPQAQTQQSPIKQDKIDNIKLTYQFDQRIEQTFNFVRPFDHEINVNQVSSNFEETIRNNPDWNEYFQYLDEHPTSINPINSVNPENIPNYTAQSDDFTFDSNNERTLNSNGDYYSLSLAVSKTNTNAWPNFYLKYWNLDHQIQYQPFTNSNSASDNHQTTISFNQLPKKDVNKILGIVFEDQKQKFDLQNSPLITLPTKANHIINISNITNNQGNINVNLTTPLESSITSVALQVKSTNAFMPFSKVVNATIGDSRHTLIFSQSELPANSSHFIIVAAQTNLGIDHYQLADQYQFVAPSFNSKPLELKTIRFFKDELKRTVVASANFNWNYQLSSFANKWFEFIFEPTLTNPTDFEIYKINFVKDYKVIVPFNKLWKFGLNGFDENVQYTLKSLKVVEPYTLNDYDTNVMIHQVINKAFVYRFNYNNPKPLQTLNPEAKPTPYLHQPNLLTTRTDLTFNDLISYWLHSNPNTIYQIPYSLQNQYALFEYWTYYHNKSILANNFKPKTNFQLVNQQNHLVSTHFIAPREIINQTVFHFEHNNNVAYLTKDLSEYHNLDQHANSAFFVLRVELDTKKRVLSELNSLIETESANAKSFVQIGIPYQLLKQKKVLTNLPFTFFQARGSNASHQVLLNELLDQFDFQAELDSNHQMRINIFSTHGNVKLFNYLPDAYFSLEKSAFIGNSTFFVNWADTDPNQQPISFHGEGLKDNLSIDLNQLYIDSDWNTSHHQGLFTPYINFNKAAGTKRLYQEDNSEALNNLRARTFSFGLGGTWSVLGKVLPRDRHDFRFYVTTNWHVWSELDEDKENRPNLTNVKVIKSPNFPVPIMFHRPTDPNSRNINPIYNETTNTWRLRDLNLKLTSVTNFNDDQDYPHKNQYKNSYGEISLKHADLVVAIVDMSFFFQHFSLTNLDHATYQNQPLTPTQKHIVRFFLNWAHLPMVKPTKLVRNLNESNNLNWYLGSFPYETSFNHDSTNDNTIRYREYLLGNIPEGIGNVQYAGTTAFNKSIAYSTQYLDLAGGSSGTSVYDAQGNLAGFVVQGTNAGTNNPGSISFFVIDGQKYDYLGSGDAPQNPASFYERIRLLSYLYPNQYDGSNFTHVKTNYFGDQKVNEDGGNLK